VSDTALQKSDLQASEPGPGTKNPSFFGNELESSTPEAKQLLTIRNEVAPEIPSKGWSYRAQADITASGVRLRDRPPAPNRQPHVKPKSSKLQCCIIC
jgi:hypothetical protein